MTEVLKVLIIEADPDVALGCAQAMQLEGIAAECVGSAEQARRRLSRDFRGIVISVNTDWMKVVRGPISS